MDAPPQSPFASLIELAEVASAGVRHNLATRDTILAGILQPVASAAWQVTDDPRDLRALWRAAEDALTQLDLVCGATGERRFLNDVLAFCHQHTYQRDGRPGGRHPPPRSQVAGPEIPPLD